MGDVGLEGDDFMEQPELWVVEPKERGGELYERSYSGENSDGAWEHQQRDQNDAWGVAISPLFVFDHLVDS